MSTDALPTTPTVDEQAQKEMQMLSCIYNYQLYSLLGLIPCAIVMVITEWWSPDFFNFPYWEPTSLEKISKFLPLFVYGTSMTYVFSSHLKSTEHDHSILKLRLITSALAGLWEEFGFRYLFICTSMILLIALNWLCALGLGVIIGGVIAVIGFWVCMASDEIKGPFRFIPLCVGAYVCILGMQIGWTLFWGTNPVFWLYETVFLPVANVLTAGYFYDIFYGEYPRLFVFGMLLANGMFRNVHAYQGLFGMINSWIIGFVMIHATLTYGLWTAVAIHMLYDMNLGIVSFVLRKMRSPSIERA